MGEHFCMEVLPQICPEQSVQGVFRFGGQCVWEGFSFLAYKYFLLARGTSYRKMQSPYKCNHFTAINLKHFRWLNCFLDLRHRDLLFIAVHVMLKLSH